MAGTILDPEKYEGKPDAPTFLGVVRDSLEYKASSKLDTGWNETLMEVVVAGEYAWEDKSNPNTRLKVIKNGNLMTMRLPSDQLVNTRLSSEEHYEKYFVGMRFRWQIRQFKRVCNGYGSPHCFLWRKSNQLKVMMATVGKMKFMTKIKLIDHVVSKGFGQNKKASKTAAA